MSSIGNYCKVNEFLLNLEKGNTESMLFGTAQSLKLHGRSLNIIYNNAVINFVIEYVYLGNLMTLASNFDNHMTLASNFERADKKVSGRLRLLHNVRRYLTAESAKMIFELVIMPILTYSSTTKTSFNHNQLQKFSSLEKRATKVIGYELNQWKSIKDTIDNQICSPVKNCLKKKFGYEVLDNYFEILNHGKHARNNNCSLKLPPIKLKISKQSFYYDGVKLFNSLPRDERKSMFEAI